MIDDYTRRTDQNRRGGSRRHADAALESDMQQVRAEMKALVKRQYDLENEIHLLERKHDRLEGQLTGAKGALLGMGIVLSGFIYLIGDRVKELIMR